MEVAPAIIDIGMILHHPIEVVASRLVCRRLEENCTFPRFNVHPGLLGNRRIFLKAGQTWSNHQHTNPHLIESLDKGHKSREGQVLLGCSFCPKPEDGCITG